MPEIFHRLDRKKIWYINKHSTSESKKQNKKDIDNFKKKELAIYQIQLVENLRKKIAIAHLFIQYLLRL